MEKIQLLHLFTRSPSVPAPPHQPTTSSDTAPSVRPVISAVVRMVCQPAAIPSCSPRMAIVLPSIGRRRRSPLDVGNPSIIARDNNAVASILCF